VRAVRGAAPGAVPGAFALESRTVPIIRRLAAPLAAIILTMSPAAALAQSAGDQQYADPFGNNEQNQSGGGSSGGGGGGGSGGGQGQAAPSATGVAATQAQGATGTSSATGSAVQSGQGELPRTGLDAGLVAVLGAGLLLAGLALRRRTADARR
jgi:LPXTG-motif cell wall-anchored protein